MRPYIHLVKEKQRSICDLEVNQSVKIKKLLTVGLNRKRLMELGFIVGEKVILLMKSPSGNPIAYFVKNTVIALRKSDASEILI